MGLHAGIVQGVDLGMGCSGLFVVATSEHLPPFDNHGTNHGVGRGPSPALCRQIQGLFHVGVIE